MAAHRRRAQSNRNHDYLLGHSRSEFPIIPAQAQCCIHGEPDMGHTQLFWLGGRVLEPFTRQTLAKICWQGRVYIPGVGMRDGVLLHARALRETGALSAW